MNKMWSNNISDSTQTNVTPDNVSSLEKETEQSCLPKVWNSLKTRVTCSKEQPTRRSRIFGPDFVGSRIVKAPNTLTGSPVWNQGWHRLDGSALMVPSLKMDGISTHVSIKNQTQWNQSTTFSSEGAEGGAKADMFTASAVDCICRCAHVGHRGNPGSLKLFSDSVALNQSWGSSIVYVINNHQGLHDWIFPQCQCYTDWSCSCTLSARPQRRFSISVRKHVLHVTEPHPAGATAGKHDLNIMFDPHSDFWNRAQTSVIIGKMCL